MLKDEPMVLKNNYRYTLNAMQAYMISLNWIVVEGCCYENFKRQLILVLQEQIVEISTGSQDRSGCFWHQ